MTEFKPGDIVRMIKGEPYKPGYEVWVREVTSGVPSTKKIRLSRLRAFEDGDWTVELIERPAPPLPTRPNTLGWANVNGIRRFVRLGVFGQWEAYNKDGALVTKPRPGAVEDFTEAVLIPKELADKVMEWVCDEGGEWHAGGILEQIAVHLKGQDDE
ncbi:hypothetical protein M3B11_02770 [Brevibacterium sp. p3-SID960]|uniref:hypothetical protein n=1 Tax=Brevibacterium sp. p3-SID960 TaxID=2916063 RepID=UPI0021A82782|nr:hypothetical protein [Brevibacterium sp. p3-SID960]MCT1689891.1 hypothetical protein [Brevibacterium sp. p3-SID960]